MNTMQEAMREAGINTSDYQSNKSAGARTFAGHNWQKNLSQPERLVSAVGGGLLALYGLTRGTPGGVALALVGGALVFRGATGHSEIYHALNINTATNDNPNVSVKSGAGIKVEKSVTINKPAEEIFRFWRNFENLPRFMNHLESVRVVDDKRSHWVAKAPAGTTVEWDAEINNEKENEMIAWRSLENADVPNAGSVHFQPAPGGRGTQVRVSLKYDPPGGIVGAAIAKLFGKNPEQQIDEDLRRFKQVMETGETPPTEGQPSGRVAGAGSR
jgi:uncharacterized membrane protein